MNASARILILDDLPTIRMIVSGMLEDHGYSNFFHANSAEIAMKALESDSVDFILADWNLPGKSGIEFLRWVRAHRKMENLPFVMMTSNNDPRQIALAKKLGASGYLVKPFGVHDLIEAMEECDPQRRPSRVAV